MSSNVMFEGDHISESIDEALSASESRGSKKGQTGGGKDDVVQFLKEVLSRWSGRCSGGRASGPGGHIARGTIGA